MRFLILVCLAAALFATSDAGAQTFPSKPLRIIVPFAAGGPADITSRIISPRMTELLGQPIVIDNRGGANGLIGAEAVIPVNSRTGSDIGFIAQLHFYLDDLFPHSLGRPLFGGKR